MKAKKSIAHSDHLTEELRDPEYAKTYLLGAIEEYAEDGDQAFFLSCLRDVVEAQMGFTELSHRTGKARQALYRSIAPEGNPTLDTVFAVLRAVGVIGKAKST